MTGYQALPATVQALDFEEITRFGLATDVSWWFIRTSPCDGVVRPMDIILWGDRVLQISVVNSTPGNDSEFIVREAVAVEEATPPVEP